MVDEAAAAAATAGGVVVVDSADACVGLKNAGNLQLEQGHLMQAIDLYSQGLELCEDDDAKGSSSSSTTKTTNTSTKTILLSNRALVYIKIENYGLALVDAEKAIEGNPSYAKAYYRRASANLALGHIKRARKDLKQVCKLKPKDRDARSKLNDCEKTIREEAFLKAIEAEQTAPLSQTFDPSKIIISPAFDGPKLLDLNADSNTTMSDEDEIALFEPGQLPREYVMRCIEWMKKEKQVHKRHLARVLLSCRKMFEATPSLLRIDIPKTAPTNLPNNNNTTTNGNSVKPRLTVCGDTHGQYYDLLNIFAINGFPASDNPYLFNGDFVDRGSFSVEVIFTLFLFKLMDPTCIYLLRGNHETKNMNRIYGFEGEVKAKYDEKMFALFLETFEWLPLAAVIDNKVFVVHGGISTDPTVTLNDVTKIKRGMEPPESGLMSDLLWSDPQPFPGKSPSKRGVGFAFGPDITKAFLKRNNLQLLVRSHEVKQEGYLVEHDGNTITVFSAPNYCDSMGNKGAFIHFSEHNNCEPEFVQFDAVPHPNVKPMQYAVGMGGLFQ
eukprot:CAMPEP_0198147094 /NCGR_PEP_ID=MMETSP1443-20131203/33199_1 /TAXON_ID=186043 /ORGANISM="Entomoneis sp., Strain CCMP2396" /LENGTH=552 /DNA_ID=CAMNT_0043811249 /DNA_START=174 /DNA_END=1832 /DNA_ORIENTATION=-